MVKQNRPLSPHLTIYKPQLTAVLSIFHRMTGVILSLSICFFIFIVKLSTFHVGNYPIYYASYYLNVVSHPIILGIFFGLLFCLYYHLYNGIRHLIWDNGGALDISKVYQTGYMVVFLTIISTISTWIALFI